MKSDPVLTLYGRHRLQSQDHGDGRGQIIQPSNGSEVIDSNQKSHRAIGSVPLFHLPGNDKRLPTTRDRYKERRDMEEEPRSLGEAL